MSETKLVRAIMQALALYPQVHAIRVNAGLTVLSAGSKKRVIKGAPAGTADIIGGISRQLREAAAPFRDVTVSQSFALEVKVGRNRLSDKQRQFLDNRREQGWVACEVRSVSDALAALGLSH